MRLLAALGVLCFLATGSVALAQVQVSVQTARTTFLLYERVDLLVTVTNMSDADITLDNTEGSPWLSFLVSKHNRLPVRAERDAEFKALTLKVGETKTLRVNLTPLFLFREEGDYKAAAVIDLPGAGQIVSDSVPFTVIEGRTVWSQTRPVDGSERVYSLIRFAPEPDDMKLYLRVEGPAENIVYANFALGDLVAYIDPDVYFDPKGDIHVLQPIAMSTYLYSRADPSGRIMDQTIFRTFQQIPPRLKKMDDGYVTVVGGQTESPDTDREVLSSGQKGIPARPVPPPQPSQPAPLPAPGASAPSPSAAAGPLP